MTATETKSVGKFSPVSFVAGAEAVAAATAVITAAGLSGPVRLTPLAARIVAERGLDISGLQGSGYTGRIFSEDLQNAPSAVPAKERVFAAPIEFAETVLSAEPFPEIPGFNAASGAFAEPVAYTEPLARRTAESGVCEQSASVYASVTGSETDAIAERTEKTESAPKEAMAAAVIASGEDVADILRMSDVRRAAAAFTAKSASQMVAVSQHMETDITELLRVRDRMNADPEQQAPIPLSAFWLKALAACIREHDRFRMRLAESLDAYLMIDGAPVGFQVHIGDSVQSLVLRDADLKPLTEIATEISELKEKAKRGGLADSDTDGSAITLINKDDTAVYAFTPIINIPEAAAFGIGAPYRRLVMTDETIENRQFIMQSLTFDHRVINGSEADEFQKRLSDILEDPQSLAR